VGCNWERLASGIRVNEKIQEDMHRLETMLKRVVDKDARFLEKLVHTEDLQVLDLACGACDEAETLTQFLASLKAPGSAGSLKLTGMDIRAREIADAAARFRKEANGNNQTSIDYEFLNGDARKLDTHQELPGKFDVIFMRHQNLWNGQRTWEEIYHKALEKLSPDGRLIITSYFDKEHEQALAAIEGQGGETIISARNEVSRKLQTRGKSVDRHVAVLKRKEI
tara:strand:+ start:9200 stop:9871 length:672 start_codon:yes stop_codon:yes gene_type:complete